MKQKYTIRDLRNEFNTEKKCLLYLYEMNHKNLNHCLKCEQISVKFYLELKRKRYITTCKHKIPLTFNTIFYRSSTPLALWFHAMFLFSVSKNGVSAKEIERQLGVTYKTAWRMANKIRSLMVEKVEVVSGIVEMDEAYIGGIKKNKHWDKKSKTGFVDKIPVVRMKSRAGKIIAKVENDTKKKTLFKNIYNHIGMNSLIITDELPAYKEIQDEGYWMHKKINHSNREYAKIETIDLWNKENSVEINISTNGIENFWSVFKRGVRGTYIRLSKKHMQSYVNEFAWRIKNKDKVLFKELIRRV